MRLSGWTFGLVVANQVALVVILTLAGHVAGGGERVHLRVDLLPAPLRGGGGVGHGRHRARAHRPLVPRQPRRLPAADGDGPAHDDGHRRARPPPGADPLPPARGAAPGPRGDHGGRPRSPRPRHWRCWRSGSRASASSSTPSGCCNPSRTCGPPSGCMSLENGINIVAAVALVGPLGVVRGIALSITLAYTVSAVAALAHLRNQVHGPRWRRRACGPLVHVAVATGALGGGRGSRAATSRRSETQPSALFVAGRRRCRGRRGRLRRSPPASSGGEDAGRRPAAAPGDRGLPASRRAESPGSTRGSRRGPAPLPPAGRPPLRPSQLGPTRRTGPKCVRTVADSAP